MKKESHHHHDHHQHMVADFQKTVLGLACPDRTDPPDHADDPVTLGSGDCAKF